MKKFVLLAFTFLSLSPLYSQGLIELFYNALKNSSADGSNPFGKNTDCTAEEFKYLNGGFFKAQELGLDLKDGYRAIEVFNERSHEPMLGKLFQGPDKRVFFITRRNGSPVGYSYEFAYATGSKYYLGLPMLLSDKYEEKVEVMKLFDESLNKFVRNVPGTTSLEPLLIVLMNPFSKEVVSPEEKMKF